MSYNDNAQVKALHTILLRHGGPHKGLVEGLWCASTLVPQGAIDVLL